MEKDQAEKNETHRDSIFLYHGQHQKEDSESGVLSNRGDVSRFFYEASARSTVPQDAEVDSEPTGQWWVEQRRG